MSVILDFWFCSATYNFFLFNFIFKSLCAEKSGPGNDVMMS